MRSSGWRATPLFTAWWSTPTKPRQLLQTLADLQHVIVNRVTGAATGQAPYHLVVELRFPSEEAMQGSLNAEEGQAMAQDFQAFASGGVTILFRRTASA
jgi:uncharacterized protein (TIGR02118 family)